MYKREFGKRRGPYAGTSEPKHNTFESIAKATKSDMLFYRIANNEVHPTFGEAAMVTGSILPLPEVPPLPAGITHTVGESTV